MSKPEWSKPKYIGYDDIIDSFGYKSKYEYFGSYQGDIVVIVEDGSRKGYLIIGYGSCSGCDELEAVMPWCYCKEECSCDWSEVEDLRDRLLRSIIWDKEIPEENDGNHWWSYDKEMYAWLKENYYH